MNWLDELKREWNRFKEEAKEIEKHLSIDPALLASTANEFEMKVKEAFDRKQECI